MEEKTDCVYILTNYTNRVLFTWVTNNLERRVYEHKHKLIDGFSKNYNCNKLVWYAGTASVESAIAEEKRIKAGSRRKKVDLVNEMNPEWKDLSLDWD